MGRQALLLMSRESSLRLASSAEVLKPFLWCRLVAVLRSALARSKRSPAAGSALPLVAEYRAQLALPSLLRRVIAGSRLPAGSGPRPGSTK
jgi:hypothetical protein